MYKDSIVNVKVSINKKKYIKILDWAQEMVSVNWCAG